MYARSRLDNPQRFRVLTSAMKAVVQRASRASVNVNGQVISQIGRGLLVLLGIGKNDTQTDADWMINKLLNLRIFLDDAGKMNRSVTDISGEILVVSQFTLYGDARKGTRPSFTDAMPPAAAEKFYNDFTSKLRAATPLKVAEGKFAAMMNVELVNDGPVTIILESFVGQAARLSNPSNATERTGGPPVPQFVPFDPATPVAKSARHLPHWEQSGRTYFITFRLADSLLQERLEGWQQERDRWQAVHPEPWSEEARAEFERLFPQRLEQWLDAGHGECLLRQPTLAAIVEACLRHFHGQRYVLGAYVVMPNHVHAVVTPLGDWTIYRILQTWKSYTAHQINHRLQRSGPVWQDESFDHIVRNEQALERIDEYIRQNPSSANLQEGEYRCGTGAS